jgi:hypothetical protein
MLGNVREITEYIWIQNVASLANLEGLRRLTTVGGYIYINGNANLVSIEGLRNLKSIQGGGTTTAINLVGNTVLASGLPFPSLTCKTGTVYPTGNTAYVTANMAEMSNLPPC